MVKSGKQAKIKGGLAESPSHLMHRALQLALDIYAEEAGPDGLTQRQFDLGTPDPNGVWTAFRGALWIAASIFGLCQVPLIMKNMIKDEEPGPISPDTGL